MLRALLFFLACARPHASPPPVIYEPPVVTTGASAPDPVRAPEPTHQAPLPPETSPQETSPQPTSAQPATSGAASGAASGAVNAPVEDVYDPVPGVLLDCQLTIDERDTWIAQLACPQDRVLSDHRGAHLPSSADALSDLMGALATLGLTSLPRQGMATLPGTEEPVVVVDATGSGPALTAWLVTATDPPGQVLTCMALQGDEEAQSWCLRAMSAMRIGTVD